MKNTKVMVALEENRCELVYNIGLNADETHDLMELTNLCFEEEQNRLGGQHRRYIRLLEDTLTALGIEWSRDYDSESIYLFRVLG